MGLFDKVFGSHSDKELKRISKTVDKIEALDESMQKLSDEELRHKTVEFKERLANGETLDDLLPEAYATVREASSRAIGLKHYRVQLIGGIILGYIWQRSVKWCTAVYDRTLTYSSVYGFWGLVILMCWQQIGYMMIIYVAGLQSVPGA